MSHTQSAFSVLYTTAVSLGQQAVSLGSALLGTYAALVRRRKIRLALNCLDDYLLKDIGIARSDIERIAGGNLPRR